MLLSNALEEQPYSVIDGAINSLPHLKIFLVPAPGGPVLLARTV